MLSQHNNNNYYYYYYYYHYYCHHQSIHPFFRAFYSNILYTNPHLYLCMIYYEK